MCAVCACVCVCVECVCLYLHTVKVQTLSTVGQNNKFRILGCEANSVPRVFLFILDFRKNKNKKKRKMNSLAFSHSPEGFAQRNNSLCLQKKPWLLEATLPFQWLLTLRGFQTISAGLIWRFRLKADTVLGVPSIRAHLTSQHFCGALLPPFCGCANRGRGGWGVWENLYLGCGHEVLWLLWNL